MHSAIINVGCCLFGQFYLVMEMSETNGINENDRNLFRRTVDRIQPLTQDKVLTHSKGLAPILTKTHEDVRNVISEMVQGKRYYTEVGAGDELFYKRSGVQDKVIRKLRQGRFSIMAELDMHGMIVSKAKNVLTEFIANSRAKNHKCIKIIHGKGFGSKKGKPVLKQKVDLWLRQRNDILAYCSARPNDGGTGVIYVLIRRLA